MAHREARPERAEDRQGRPVKSDLEQAMETLTYRAGVVMETKKIIADLQKRVDREDEGLRLEMQQFNEAREAVIGLCPEMATGFLQDNETVGIVDGRVTVIPKP